MGVFAKKGESREEIQKKLEAAGVEFLWASFVDIHGAGKVKQVPMAAFDDIIDEGAGFAGGAVWGVNQGPHSHDIMARADVNTFKQLPWQPNTALVHSNLHVDDEPWPACSRVNLIGEMKKFEAAGYLYSRLES